MPNSRINDFALSTGHAIADLMDEKFPGAIPPEIRRAALKLFYEVAYVSFQHYEETSDRMHKKLKPGRN